MISKYSTFPVFEARSKKVILWLRLFCIGLVVFAIPTEILISQTVDPGSYLDNFLNQLSIPHSVNSGSYFDELLDKLFYAGMNCIVTPLIIIQYLHGTSNKIGWPTLGGSILYMLLFVLIIVALWYSVCKFCSWLHSTIREQRRFSETHYSPKSASCIALIPILFPAFHYQIFKDLLAQQKETLEKNNLEAISLPNGILSTIPVLGVLIQVGWCIGIFGSKDLIAVRIISIILSIILFASYIKIIRTVTANMSTLVHWRQSTLPTTRRGQHVLRRDRIRQRRNPVAGIFRQRNSPYKKNARGEPGIF